MPVSKHFASSQWSLLFSLLCFQEGLGDRGGGLGGWGKEGEVLRVRRSRVSCQKAKFAASSGLGSSETLHAPCCELVFGFEPLDSGVWPGGHSEAWGSVSAAPGLAGRCGPKSSLAQFCLAVPRGSTAPAVFTAAVWGALAEFPD